MNGYSMVYKKYSGLLLLLMVMALQPVWGQAGRKMLSTQKADLSSFTAGGQQIATRAILLPAEKMVEVVSKRTATSRYFTDKDTASKFYSVQSLGTINYFKNGVWNVIDTRLKAGHNNIYTATAQEEPTGFDTKKQTSFIISKNQTIYFNQWKLYGGENGSQILLANANWQNFSAGEDGIHITNIFPGIDADMLVRRGAIKTNFIVRKNEFPQYGKLVFKDKFENTAGTGNFLATAPSLQAQPVDFTTGTAKLTVHPAFAYAEGSASASLVTLGSSATKNDFSLAVDAAYLQKYLASGPVIIDPLVTTTSTLAVASITGSRNCGSETVTCDYTLNATTPAKATVTSVSWKFGFEAILDMTEGFFGIELGGCTTGYYSVVDPDINHKPGTVSSKGSWVPSAELLACMPAPTCGAQTVAFKLRFANSNCSGAAGCSDAFVKADEPLQMLIEGRTLEMGSTSASATNICSGVSSTLTTVGTYGVPPYSYSWNNGAGTSSTATVTPTTTTTYTATITDQCASIATDSATITVKPSPVVNSATTNSPICEGSILQINTADIAGATFNWSGPNGFTSTTAANNITSATTAASGVYTVTATQNGCTSAPTTVTASVQAVAAPIVAIVASATETCAGTPITFTATAANAGTAPVYQWKINGVNAGGNSNTFSSSTLPTGAVISCVVTSSAVCSTTPTATSNIISVVVNAVVTPAVSIAASATTICAGSPVTFTATPVNGGASPTYQWKLNGVNVGTNSSQYTNNALANGDVVTSEMVGSAPCNTVPSTVSNSIKVTVNPIITATINIAAADTAVCINTNVNFTATTSNAGAQPTYQWKINGNNVGTNTNTFNSNSLADNDQVSCQLTSTIGCPSSPTFLSNIITMEVSAPVTPAITISTADTNVCLGVNTTFTANAINGGPAPTYQWKLNGNNVGTNSATYENAALKTGDKISCIITSNAICTTTPTATSNTLTIKVNTTVVSTIDITASTTEICSGAAVSFTATTTNEGNSPVFEWLINGLITNGDSKNFTTNNLTDGASIIAVLSPQGIGCLATSTVTSNAIVMKVNATPVVNAGNDTLIFRGNGFRLNGEASGTITSYEWSPPTYLSSASIRNPSTFPLTTITYTLTATASGNCAASDTVRIKVLTRIEVPNAFSPNGDGINDTWNIVGLAEYDGATLEIFDRYGQPILKTTGYNKPWDGTRNGKPLPVATYYYIITPQNGLQPITGSITIIR